MDHVFCTECGAENPAENAFCTECGALLDKSSLQKDDPAADVHNEDGMEAETYVEDPIFDADDLGGAPDQTTHILSSSAAPAPDETTHIPSAAPAPAPDPEPAPAPQPPDDGRRRNDTGRIVGITLASVCGVLAVAFALFYFTNPLGLTTGIFENSAAAQAAAAEEARAEAEAAQQQAEEAHRQAEEAQKAQQEAEEAQRQAEAAQTEAEEKAAEKARQEAASRSSSSSGSTSSSGTTSPSYSGSVYVGPNGIEYTHHVNSEYSDDYILPDSARRLYSVDELANLSNYELYLARNEIFARYGRMYEEGDLDSHYRSTDWYIPLYDGDDFDSVMIEDYMNDNEYKNVIVIRDLERERGSEYL